MMILFILLAVQDPVPVPLQQPSSFFEVSTDFHRAVLEAAKNRVNSATGAAKLEALKDLRRLRIAMVFPAMRNKIQEAVVMQMRLELDAGNTSDAIALDDEGRIDVARIDWEGLISFLERLIPIILQIISIFGGMFIWSYHERSNRPSDPCSMPHSQSELLR